MVKRCIANLWIIFLCWSLTACSPTNIDDVDSGTATTIPSNFVCPTTQTTTNGTYTNSEIAEPSFDFFISEKGVVITEYTGAEAEMLRLPSEIEGKPVIGLGEYLLYYHRKVEQVELPETLLSIDETAFYKAKSLKTVEIPKLISNTQVNLFYYCSALEEITVAPKNKYFSSVDGVLFDKDMKTLITYPEGKVMTQYNIPEGVQAIQLGAFGHKFPCQKLGIPSTVRSIYYNEEKQEDSDTLDCDYSRQSIILVVEPNSYAEQYAKKSGYSYEYF